MPVVGNLTEFPLPEVLNLIGKRTGQMRILDTPVGGLLVMDIQEGAIARAQTDGRPLLKPDDVLQILSHIMESGSGMFEFHCLDEVGASGTLHIPLDHLAMNLCQTVDEHLHDTRRLLEANQRFRLTGDEETWIDPDLDHFLTTVRGQLEAGLNVEDAGKITGLLPEDVLNRLVKLRELGVVEVEEAA